MDHTQANELFSWISSVVTTFLPEILRIEIVGSLRRGLVEVNDLDLVAVFSTEITDERLRTFFASLESVSDRGPVRVNSQEPYPGGGRLLRVFESIGRIDLRLSSEDRAGAAMLWLTGSREFGRSLEAAALRQGWVFTPDGVFPSGDSKRLAFDCSQERAVLQQLGGCWIDPEHRTAAIDAIDDQFKSLI